MRLENTTAWEGDIVVTGTPGDSGGTAADASIGLAATGTTDRNGSIGGSISGGDL